MEEAMADELRLQGQWIDGKIAKLEEELVELLASRLKLRDAVSQLDEEA
jgi:chorismate mutase